MMKRRELIQRASFLVGGTLSTQVTSALLGEVTNTGASVTVTKAMSQLLAEVADVIIPQTDTVGAKEAGAHEFIIRLMRDCHTLEPQKKFYAGLERIDQRSKAAYQKAFVAISRPEQIEIIKTTAEQDRGYFKQFKNFTQIGYFTSELGCTQNLRYMPIPGRFEGDVPYEKGQGIIMNSR